MFVGKTWRLIWYPFESEKTPPKSQHNEVVLGWEIPVLEGSCLEAFYFT